MHNDKCENYDDLCTYLYKKYQDALTEGDLELAARLYRAQISFKAPLKMPIFSEEFKKSLSGDDKVLNFIKRFKGSEETFTSGCCYWFARILFERFYSENYTCDIMYDYIENHFGCKINDKVYDVTGDVTFSYDWKYWIDCQDEDLIESINRDCINF